MIYIYPTVTGRSNLVPVLPSYNVNCPDSGSPASFNKSLISLSLAPSKTGVAIGSPEVRFEANSTISALLNLAVLCAIRSNATGAICSNRTKATSFLSNFSRSAKSS